MEILRIPSNQIVYKVSGLDPDDYDYTVVDLADNSITEGTLTVEDAEDVMTISLPAGIDGDYEISIAGTTEIVSVIRPYVDPTTLGTTASEIAEYTKYEMIARAIIDSYLDNTDFYNKKTVYDVIGNGLDYMSIWKDVNKVLKVYENNVLVFDVATPDENVFDYAVTLDKSALVKVFTEQTDIITTESPQLPVSRGDYIYDSRNYGTFVRGNDYIFVLDVGPKNIPSQVAKATEMLIDDLKCGRLDYYQKYITTYNTDQFRIQFDKKMLEGTGNLVVDKMLDKYLKSITRVGVL
jgi:hypothetical protein